MTEPRSPTREKTPAMAFTRVELTLDSGHSLPPMKHELNLNRQDLEIQELKRLCASAHSDVLRKPLEAEIENLTHSEANESDDGFYGQPTGGAIGEGTSRQQRSGRQGARPWSARPMSARKSSVQIMKTIPESKQHVRPLSSKMRGVSGSGITFNGEHDFQKRHRKHSHDVSSDTSVGSNDSVDNYYGEGANDEVSGHEIKQLWASSYDVRHPVRNVVDRNGGTFWMSSGLFPHVLSLQFRRTIALSKVVVYAAGARAIKLRWQCPASDAWRDKTVEMSHDAPTQSVTEFVFDVEKNGGGAASGNGTNAATPAKAPQRTPSDAVAVAIEVLSAHDAFAVIRHLNFIEHASTIGDHKQQAPDGDPLSARRVSYGDKDGASRDSSLSPVASPRSLAAYPHPHRDAGPQSPASPRMQATPGFYSP